MHVIMQRTGKTALWNVPRVWHPIKTRNAVVSISKDVRDIVYFFICAPKMIFFYFLQSDLSVVTLEVSFFLFTIMHLIKFDI